MEIRLFNTIKRRFLIRGLLRTGLVILIVSACSKKGPVPAGIISKDQMAKIIGDIYISEQKLSQASIQPDSAQKIIVYMKDRILEQNGITDSAFRVSFNYYVDHPKEMELIYTALVDSLQLKEERVRRTPQ
jgi:hypothetical protein